MTDEAEHVGRHNLGRGLADHREERLQIIRDGPQRVRPRTTRHEREIGIDQRFTQRETGFT